MSSSNQVAIRFIEESVYGETPGVGNFSTARFTSETLSGSPETTESQQIRTDRLSSGQVVTGLTVSGDINYELAAEAELHAFFESAMYNSFVSDTPVNVDMTIDTTLDTLTRTGGDWNADVAIGDVLTLSGFSDSRNNTQVMVIAINSATEIKFAGPEDLQDEVGSGTAFVVADKITIGTTKKSFSMEKAFLDLTDKAIIYRGQIAGTMSLNATYGQIATGTFNFSGNDYQTVDAAADFITDGRTIEPPATTNSMNGSVDMPYLVTSATGILSEADFCIQSVEMNLNNNLTAQNCIGQIAPDDYSEGTAQIEVSITAYLSNESWQLLGKKLTQEPFAVGFLIKNVNGFYGFFMPAVQVSFEDPSSPGQNQDVLINMSGVAKVGANGESSLVIYKG